MKSFQSTLIIIILMMGFCKVQGQESYTQKLYHVLLFNWIDQVDQNKKEEILNLLEKLPEKIEGLEELSTYNLISSTNEYETVVIMVFQSEEALEIYQKHPKHLKIKKKAKTLLVGMSKYDYWK